MTKKEQELKVEKGNRITGKKASAIRYIPFNEFLLFDPKYREMKDKAKILYAFLRKKSLDNEDYTNKHEEGEEGFTRSYRDENGEIYVIADNSELSIVLQCHPNRVKDQKDELKRYGLLDEVPQFQKASRLYMLTPKEDQLTERWTYIEEMKQLRAETEKTNKEKFKKHKEKKKLEKTSDSNDSEHNSQNVSYNNSQNVSYNNSQNVSKIYSKGFKSNPESIKPTFNLSISEDIQNSALPIPLKKILEKKIDRLIKFEINISDIDLHCNAVKKVYPENEYAFVLDNLITKMTFKPNNFASVMDDWLNRNRENLIKIIQQAKEKNEPLRKELLPDWYEPSEKRKQQDVKFNELLKEKMEADSKKKIDPEERAKQLEEIEEMKKKLRA